MTMTDKSPRPLSASLLAAKGSARPAQRSGQAYGEPRTLFQVEPAAQQHPQPSTTAKTRACQTAANPASEKVAASKKASFTFRMDEKRHFRLRLLSAHQNRSSQKILEEALDAYLEAHAPQTSSLTCPCFEGATD